MSFASIARRLAEEARRHGLLAPAFRSPPRVPGARRTIRRFSDGSAVVAVVVRGRPGDDVVSDMVEGVVVANRLDERAAAGWRLALAAAIDDERAALTSAA